MKKIRKLIVKFDNLKKSNKRRTTIKINHENSFEKLLDNCFDIAPKCNYHHTKPGPKPKISLPDHDDDSDIDGDSDSDMHSENNLNADDTDFETTLSEYEKMKLSIGQKQPNFVDKSLNSSCVFSTLERIQLSSSKFTMLCASMARAAEVEINECVISTSTVARRRIKSK